MEAILANGGLIALLVLVITVLTGIKQAMKRYEETNPPAWIGSVIKFLRKILEYATANDGQSDEKAA